jgi:hypothetical protein
MLISEIKDEKIYINKLNQRFEYPLTVLATKSLCNLCVINLSVLPCAGILEQSMGARNRVGIGLSYRPARLHRLAEMIPWIPRLLKSLKIPPVYGIWYMKRPRLLCCRLIRLKLRLDTKLLQPVGPPSLTFKESFFSLCSLPLQADIKKGWGKEPNKTTKNRKHLIAFLVCTVCTAKLGKKYWASMSCLEAAFNNN